MVWRAIIAFVVAAALIDPTIAPAAEVTFDLRIERGAVQANMRRIRVKQGDTVTLRWTADRKTILHLHGYDIEKTVEPGAIVEMSFVARATGRFPVSAHVPQAGGGHAHDPPLTHVEVHPP
jgi:FtsP/CotA-like multicopper oxidase with cupredoxin domain